MYDDLQHLLENLQTGTSDLCCFSDYDITTEYVDFETNGDPVAAAQNIFVSFCIWRPSVHLHHDWCSDFRVKGSSMSYFSTAILSMLEGYYVRSVCLGTCLLCTYRSYHKVMYIYATRSVTTQHVLSTVPILVLHTIAWFNHQSSYKPFSSY